VRGATVASFSSRKAQLIAALSPHATKGGCKPPPDRERLIKTTAVYIDRFRDRMEAYEIAIGIAINNQVSSLVRRQGVLTDTRGTLFLRALCDNSSRDDIIFPK
jgi:hypothetical protein